MSNWYNHYKEKINEYGGIHNYKKHKIAYKLPLLELVKKYAKNMNIMEVGSGVGISLIELNNQGYHVIGVESDNSMFNLSMSFAKEFNSDIKILNKDLMTLDYSKYNIDVIFSNGVMEHFSDSEIIDIINNQLKSNAHIIISIPTNYFSSDMAYNGDERFLSPKIWINIINKTNGKIHEMYSYDDKKIQIHKISNIKYLKTIPRFFIFVIK